MQTNLAVKFASMRVNERSCHRMTATMIFCACWQTAGAAVPPRRARIKCLNKTTFLSTFMFHTSTWLEYHIMDNLQTCTKTKNRLCEFCSLIPSSSNLALNHLLTYVKNVVFLPASLKFHWMSKAAPKSGWLRKKNASTPPPSLDPILSLPVWPSRTLF